MQVLVPVPALPVPRALPVQVLVQVLLAQAPRVLLPVPPVPVPPLPAVWPLRPVRWAFLSPRWPWWARSPLPLQLPLRPSRPARNFG